MKLQQAGAEPVRRSRRRRRATMVEINMTPMVDVMLVLLIVFMVAAPLLTSGIAVDLPQAASSPMAGQDEPLSVTIDAGGKIYLQDSQIALDQLAPRLQALLSAPPAAPAQVSGTALPAGVAAPAALDEDYRKLLDLLADSPAPVDLLVRRSGLTAEIVSSMLLILELEGYVATAPGGLYSRLV